MLQVLASELRPPVRKQAGAASPRTIMFCPSHLTIQEQMESSTSPKQ